MTPARRSLSSDSSSGPNVVELVTRLSVAERELTDALGPHADAVVDSNGHAFLLRQAQTALRQNEQRFRTLIEKSTDVIALLAADGTVLYDSPAVTRALGYAPAELVGQNVFTLFHPGDRERARTVFTQLCATPRASSTVVLRCRHKGGGYRALEGTGTNLLDEPGVKAVVLNYRDITERTKAEAALRESEERFRQLVQSLPAAVYTCDVEGRITLYNEAAVKLWGRRPELKQDRWCGSWRTYHPDGSPVSPATCPMTRALTEGRSVRGREIIIERPDGSRSHVLPYPDPIRDSAGRVTGAVNMLVDLTERKQAELALQSSEAHYRTMLQGVEAGVIVHGPDLRITAFNAKALEILGVTAAQIAARNPADPLWSRVRVDGAPYAPEDLPASRALATRQPVRDVVLGFVRNRQSEFVWVLVSANPVLSPQGDVAEVIVSFMDVTARIRAEEALRDNATFTEDVLNSLMSHVAVLNPDGAIIAVNEAWRRFARENGAGTNDFVGHNYLAVCRNIVMSEHAVGADEAADGIAAVLSGTRANFTTEYPCHSPTAARWFRLRVSPLGGGRRGVVVSHQDITEQRQGTESLRASEKRFKALFEQAAVGVAQTEVKTGRFVQINRRFCEILDYSWEDLRHLSFAAVTHAEDVDGSLEKMRQLEAGTLREFNWEKRYRRRDGSAVWASLTVSAMWAPDETPDFFIAVAQDITARKELEEQFRQAQKMEAIGQLSGGVAHDFNNMLAVIKGHIGLLEATGAVTPAVAESLQEISIATDRATNLTRQLLMFSRRQVMQPRILDLGDATVDMAKMLRRMVEEKVTIELKRPPYPLLVRADAGMIDQVLLNLTVNARDAMPRGGPVIITSDRVECTAETLRQQPGVRPGAYARLSVSDTGTGIAPDILPRIFEPFFTTKEVGKGTGLGLATVYGIVRQHEGWIDVRSEVGRGTTFEIYLPCTTDSPRPAPSGHVTGAPEGGTETILLVEDEPAVRFTMEAVLLQQGYRVRSAEDGAQALQLWLDHESEIDLLLTDVVMPGNLTGKDLADQLMRRRPALRVIYMSGYNQEFADSSLLQEGENFLAKPFTPTRLLATVRANLDARRDGPRPAGQRADPARTP